MSTSRRLWPAAVVLSACATPSRGDLAEREAEVRRLTSARAVFMPKEVESCVGVTLRLSEEGASRESVTERDELSKRLTLEEVKGAIERAGVLVCRDVFFDAVNRRATSPEPLQVSMSYGIDASGRVCAVVERQRMEPIDVAAVPLLEESASCVKDALFRARFPVDRVKDRERIVLTYTLVMDPTQGDSSKPPAANSGSGE